MLLIFGFGMLLYDFCMQIRVEVNHSFVTFASNSKHSPKNPRLTQYECSQNSNDTEHHSLPTKLDKYFYVKLRSTLN